MKIEKMRMDEGQLCWSPITKELLINYVKHQYEEEADISDESLIQEYNYLASRDELHFLFESEYVFNNERLENERF